MDKIEIRNLECYCHHGVLKEENVLGQKFLVSAVLYLDTREAGRTDDLNQSVDYAEVAHRLDTAMKEKSFHLIEAAAEHLAHTILQEYDILNEVEICIKKPWAPILLPLDTVEIKIHRGWTRVYVAFGSNMGDRNGYIQQAIEGIRRNEHCRKDVVSQIRETEPYGYTEQAPFLNGVISFETLYTPRELLIFLQNLEQKGNRTREIHWGPRTIDLDILFYGDRQIMEEDLIIPHPEIPLRGFVLEPMKELAPYFKHPVFNKTILQMWNEWK